LATVTLTFDNGPEPTVTPHVLDCLKQHGILASFFVIGRKLVSETTLGLVERASREGHWSGNHTFTHATPLGLLDADEAVREIERTKILLAWLKQPVRLFRPHGGAGRLGSHLLQTSVVEKLQRDKYTCVIWNSVPGDFRDPHGWMERALTDVRTRDWSLIVLHDLPNDAMDHLDEFLCRLRDTGTEFRQAFPPECLPMIEGRIVLPLDEYVKELAEAEKPKRGSRSR